MGFCSKTVIYQKPLLSVNSKLQIEWFVDLLDYVSL